MHGTRLSPLYPYIEAEARYAVRAEYALNAVDFIARRTRLSFLNVQATVETLPRVIDIMGEELGWNASRKEKEFDQAVYFLRSMGLPEGHNLNWHDMRKNKGTKTFLELKPEEAALYSRAQFTPDEVNSLRKQFEQMDFVSDLNCVSRRALSLTSVKDHDQRITRADLIHAMTQMGYESSTETADSILREVDFGRKGYIEFQEYLDVSLVWQCWPSRSMLIDTLDRCWLEGAFSRVRLHPPGPARLEQEDRQGLDRTALARQRGPEEHEAAYPRREERWRNVSGECRVWWYRLGIVGWIYFRGRLVDADRDNAIHDHQFGSSRIFSPHTPSPALTLSPKSVSRVRERLRAELLGQLPALRDRSDQSIDRQALSRITWL